MTEYSNSAKQKIINTTIRLVKEKGYANVKIDDICADSSLTKGAFYYYFKSKEDVLGQYLMEQIGQVDRDRRSYFNEIFLAESCYTQLQLVFKPLVDVCEQIGPEIILQVMLANYDGRYVSSLIGRGSEDNVIITNLIAKGQKQGVFRNRQNAEILCEIFGDAVYGMMFYWCYSNAKFDLGAKVKEMIRGLMDVPEDIY